MVRLRDSWPFSLSSAPTVGNPCRPLQPESVSLGRAVRLDLRLRRFYCRNAACTRRTLAERLPELIRPHARRTGRLAQAQARVGVALGGEGSARLLQHLAMPASADTVLRLIRRLPPRYTTFSGKRLTGA